MVNTNADSSAPDDMTPNEHGKRPQPMNDFQISLMHIANNLDRMKPLVQKMRGLCHPETELEGAIHVQERLYCFMKLRHWQLIARLSLILILSPIVFLNWQGNLSLDFTFLNVLIIVMQCSAAIWLLSWLYTILELGILTKQKPSRINSRYSMGLFLRGHVILPLILAAMVTILLIKFKFPWLVFLSN